MKRANSMLASVDMALHHKLCHTLGGSFDLPHAETHTIVLPHALAYNAPAAPEAMQRIARALGADDAAQGVTELILVAQETTIYGLDLYGKKSLHLLLRELCRIEGLHWIRVLYAYPEEMYPELIDTFANEKKICHYLDLPIQHASDGILRKMNRRTSEADLRALLAELRRRIPDIFIRTSLITGFPGETEEDHEILKAFVTEMKFDRLGVFTYSKEEDTAAARMKQQVPKRIKTKRRNEIMRLQQKISLAAGKSRIGQTIECVIEGELPEDGIYEARTYGDAPGVDGLVFIPMTYPHMSGDFVNVRITGASHYDLTGEEIAD